MKTKLIFAGWAALVVFIIVGGLCSKPAVPDPEVEHLERVWQCVHDQMEAQGNYFEASSKEMQCANAGDTNGAAVWDAKAKEYDRLEHAAHDRLERQ